MESWIGFLTGLVVSTLVITALWRPDASQGQADARVASALPLPLDSTQADAQENGARRLAATKRPDLSAPQPLRVASRTGNEQLAETGRYESNEDASDSAHANDQAAAATARAPGVARPSVDRSGGLQDTQAAAPATVAASDDSSAAAATDAVPADLPEFRWDPAPETQSARVSVAGAETPVADAQQAPDAGRGAALSGASAARMESAAPALSDSADETGAADARNWHAFWRPFSSELSARGFGQRLEQVTGLDYRVVRVTAAEYHVAFAYDDDEERLASLAAIEQATGLSLDEGLR